MNPHELAYDLTPSCPGCGTDLDSVDDSVPSHVCRFDHDTSTSPDYAGRIVVTEWCACGREIQRYIDSIR